jgi:hypothetical protein
MELIEKGLHIFLSRFSIIYERPEWVTYPRSLMVTRHTFHEDASPKLGVWQKLPGHID